MMRLLAFLLALLPLAAQAAQYAVVNPSGQVVNVVEWDGASSFTPPSGDTLQAIGSSGAGIGWTYANGTFANPHPISTTLTPAQQAQTQYNDAIAAGITVTSSSNPSGLNGTYSLGDDPATGKSLTTEVTEQVLQLVVTGNGNPANGTFLNGTTSLAWPDANGALHSFNPTQFVSFAQKMGGYINALVVAKQTEAAGGSPSWPSSSVTIN